MPAPILSELPVRAAGDTHVGRRRRHNEDCVLLRPDLGLYLVADGAGGHSAGDVAAQVAVKSVAEFLERPRKESPDHPALKRLGIDGEARALSAAIHYAHKQVLRAAAAAQTEKGMGTTLVGLLFSSDGSRVHIAHVGDSRCYQLRADHLELLTVDHSIATDVLEKRPDLPDSVLGRLPTNVVTRALGMGEGVRVAVASRSVVMGDRYLICSDGLSNVVPAQSMAEALIQRAEPAATVRDLIQRALDAGAPDNVAALVVDCTGGSQAAIPVEWLTGADLEDIDDRASDPELLILGIEELNLSSVPSSLGDDLIRALDDTVKKHK